ncbi:MAG: EAL domain-containing protein [Acidobacteria bacterium]|nr:EAL domain-containing protein [Acidobacteriota bacterium]
MSARKHKLLVVDDEFLNRDMLKQRLLRSGFEVTEAENAQDALHVIGEGGIDLVLLDMMMPGMSGIDLLKLLRGVHGQNELPVIMTTAVTDSQSIAGALNLGANDYVTKPIDFPVALARVTSQLNRRDAEQRLRQSEERYALAQRGNEDGIWDWDLASNRIYYSPHWIQIAGLGSASISDNPDEWFKRVHPEDLGTLLGRLKQHWVDGAARPFFCEYRLRCGDGLYRWMRARGHTVRDATGRAIRTTGSQSDINEQKAHDSLTGLANRLFFLERAGLCLERARRVPQSSFAILFLDLDRFKLINDTMGHLAGDRVLVDVAARLSASLQGEQTNSQAHHPFTVARFGGDEFAILLEELPQPDDAPAVAQRLLQSLELPFHLNGRDVYSTASIGIAIWNPAYASVEDLLRDSDTAMYAAKARGGAGFMVFDEALRQRAATRLEIETGLRQAIERHELAVYYQAKINLQSGALVGFEALLRWRHPTLGLVSPADFITIAEETGLIIPIGEWAIREACRQMVAWQTLFPRVPALAISVNLSVRQFRQPDLPAKIAAILAESGLSPRHLQLEITESILMDEPETAIVTTRKLKDLGVGIKLDDFGTGYSSLSYLCRMPIDTLKIDRSFILRMRDNNTDLEIVRTVIALARTLGMEVVAEGVECQDQVSQLRSLGCQFGQGYYFGRPIAAREISHLLAATTEDGTPDPDELARQ